MVYRSPQTLLYELGITEPHEIDVEAIAYHCGAIVNYRHLDGCSARIIGYGDRAAISVDANSIRRRRFLYRARVRSLGKGSWQGRISLPEL